jgi:hypothetical protein|tara:strand:- start:1386 stop:1646 length:261 start_codon:yes stop_codon:yes gene_type:complete
VALLPEYQVFQGAPLNIPHQGDGQNIYSIPLNFLIMKFKILVLTLLLGVGLNACTPTDLVDQVQNSDHSPMATGDDLSLRPDNDKD